MITQLEHPALSVANLDRSVAFYRDLLGFQLARLIEPRDDGLLGTITGLPGARARIAHLTLGNQMLELFEYLQPRGQPAPRTQAEYGFSHIGFRTDDARGDYQRLRALGVEFLSPPVEFRPEVWVAYFRGPDGEVCELRQT
jgi:catechol 2,3-dioxygenase-like lactoylglutathione lyase family enzyme